MDTITNIATVVGAMAAVAALFIGVRSITKRKRHNQTQHTSGRSAAVQSGRDTNITARKSNDQADSE
ncbi:MAG: hypothetical protein AB7U75_17285 [Hyphomicrobiaceae bacterium]